MNARRQIASICVCCLLGGTLLLGDDLSVDFDPAADFSRFKTFAIRATTIDSPRPELDNPLFVKQLTTAIRTALSARRLAEAAAGPPDLFVDVRVVGEDFSLTQRGMPMPAGPGRRTVSSGPQPLRFAEGTLIVDLARPGESTPVWRGVYRDKNSTGSRLVENLPAGAVKLLARYPPDRRMP